MDMFLTVIIRGQSVAASDSDSEGRDIRRPTHNGGLYVLRRGQRHGGAVTQGEC